MKVIIHALVALFIQSAFGQAYIPLPTHGATWDVGIFGWGYSSHLETICGSDTLINSTAYKKVFQHDYYSDSIYSSEYKGALRNDSLNKQVWYIPTGQSTEFLLYDFSLNEGDSVPLTYYRFSLTDTFYAHVDSVWAEHLAGKNRKVMLMRTYFQEKWIEGIGSDNGLLLRSASAFDSSPRLECFSAANESTYFSDTTLGECTFYQCEITTRAPHINAQNNLTIFPNPALTHVTLLHLTENNISTFALINSRGQHIRTFSVQDNTERLNVAELPQGLYFILFYTDNTVAHAMKLVK